LEIVAFVINLAPLLALWGAKYLGILASFADFLVDAATGNLPAVSFLDPRLTILGSGGNVSQIVGSVEVAMVFESRSVCAAC
jgi:hypothetical protein